MENDEKIEQKIADEENTKQKTFDVAGLLIGAVVGVVLAIIGITDILMGIIAVFTSL